MTKTSKSIEELKDEWLLGISEIYCIENTEGFEEHHDELLTWRLNQEKMEEERKEKERKKLEEQAKKYDCSIQLCKKLIELENKYNEQEEVIEELRDRIKQLESELR